MTTRSLSALSLTSQQLQSFAVDNLSADPTGAGLYQGRLWWNTTSKLLKYYDGTAVQVVAAQAYANPMTTQYDLIQGGASGVPTRLAKGANNTVLAVDGSGVGSYRTLVNADVNAAAAIAGTKLAANAVTLTGFVWSVPASTQSFSTVGTWTDITGASLSITLLAGTRLLIVARGVMSHSAASAASQLGVFFSGALQLATNGGIGAGAGQGLEQVVFSVIDSPGAGALAVKLQALNSTTGTLTLVAQTFELHCIELRR